MRLIGNAVPGRPLKRTINLLELLSVIHAEPCTLAQASARSGITETYAQQLAAAMRRADLIKARKGWGGGYTIDSLQGRTLLELVDLMDPVAPYRVRSPVEAAIRAVLAETSLEQILGQAQKLAASAQDAA